MKKEIKILVISDVHKNAQGLIEVVQNAKHDYSIIAGDFELDDSFISKNINYIVKGNNDWQSNFHDKLDFEICGIRFHLEHGHLIGSYSQLNDYEFMKKVFLNNNCDILIFGHTHQPTVFQYEKGIALNPGSITAPRGGYKPSYAIITMGADQKVSCEIFEYKK